MSTNPARTLYVIFLILTPIGWAVTAVMQAWATIHKTTRKENKP